MIFVKMILSTIGAISYSRFSSSAPFSCIPRPTPVKKELGRMGAERPSGPIPFLPGWGGLVAKQADEGIFISGGKSPVHLSLTGCAGQAQMDGTFAPTDENALEHNLFSDLPG
jgi:hypothetical protein